MSRVLRPRKGSEGQKERPVEEDGSRNLRKRKLDTNYYPSDLLDLTPVNSESDTGSDYVDSEAGSSDDEKKKKLQSPNKNKKKNDDDEDSSELKEKKIDENRTEPQMED